MNLNNYLKIRRRRTISGISLFSAVFFSVLFSLWSITAKAQSPTISYPSVAQDLTRGYSQSNLTVKLVFNGVCTGTNTVRIALPASVTYVAGTVAKTGGTASVSITESSIADLSRPEFSITGIASVGDEITFTVTRRADCGSLATAKDSIYFISGAGCSDASEVSGVVNVYNIFAPALSITPATAITSAVVGSTYSRTTVVTNGGNGPLDTLRFYVVYPNGGIVNTNTNYRITANSVNFDTVRKSGDTLFYRIYGATLFGGDNLLTSGETVTIQEPIRVVKCNTTTTYGSGWGRNSATVCQWVTGSSSMTMAAGVPNLSLVFSRVSEGNLCTGDVWQYTLTNTGSESISGAGAAMSISALLGTNSWSTPSSASVSFAWATLGDFSINGVPLTATGTGTVGKSIDFGQLTSDPDGAGGLTDVDGDGQYDDLPVGASVVLRYTLNWDCSKFPTTCNSSSSDITPNARFYFKNQCGVDFDRYNTSPISTLRYVIGTANTLDVSGPTDISGGVTFRPQFCLNTQGENTWPANSVNGTLRLTLTLPAGISVVGSGSATVSVDGAAPVAITATISGSTVTFERPHLLGFHNICYELDLVGSCPTAAGAASISYAADYLNDPIACPSCVWHLPCGAYTVNVKCPCAIPLGVNNNVAATAERITLGWTDKTLTTKLSSGSVSANALKRLLPYDTARITQAGIQFAGATYSNLHYKYGFDENSGGASYLNYGGGTITIYKASPATSYTCSLPAPTISHSGGRYDWDFDIASLIGGACLPSGLLFEPADSFVVSFLVTYANVATTGNALVQLPGSKGYFYNLSGATELYCNNWGTELYLIPTYASNSYTTVSLTSGCASTISSAFSAIVYNGGVDYFPEEFRPSRYVDSFQLVLQSGVEFDNSTSTQLRYVDFNGSNTTFNIADPVVRGDTLIFINPGTWYIGDIARITYYSNYTFLVPIKSNCAITEGNFSYKLRSFGRNNYYQYNLSSLAGISTSIAPQTNYNLTSNTVAYGNKPATSVANLTGTVQGVSANHYWDVRITSTGTTTAPYVWMALEKGTGTGGIIVDSVKLLPSLTTLTPTSTYNGTDKWYQISTAGLASGASQQARVFFHYTSCSLDSIQLKAGWNCSGYPSPDPGSYPCTASSTYLTLDPQPSQVQLSVERQPGGGSSINLCTTDSTIIVVNSAQSANLVSPYLTFYPPSGLSLVTPIRVEYPRGSGNYQNATVSSLTGGGYKIDLSAHTGIGTNGMLGTANASPSYSPLGGDREARVIATFTTDCAYTSGTSLKFNAYGNRPCGQPAIDNGVASTTSALNITGATAAGGAGVTISFGGSPVSVSCGSSLITLSLITTPTSLGTTIGDTMVYTLPIGLGYAGNLTSGFSAIVSGGMGAPTKVKVPMPTGVSSGTPINYSFDVSPQGGGCGVMNITGEYKRLIAPLMCGATPCASSSVVIASGTSPNITVNKPSLIIGAMSKLDDSAKWVMGGWLNIVKVDYTNNGTQAYTANSDTIEFYCNSTATTPFYKAPLRKNVAIGASASDTFGINIWGAPCIAGDFVEARIPTYTAAGTPQCLCSPSALSASAPLPLGIQAFKAQNNACAVQLSWDYSEETANKLKTLVVQRSADGEQFEVVSSLPSGVKSYVDVSPYSGQWLYRLRADYHNGRSEYSPTILTHTSSCKENTVEVYPNPVQHHLYIVLQGNTQDNRYELIDALGRKVLQGSLEQNHNNALAVQNLPSGVYMLRIHSDSQVSTQQVQIVR